MQIAERPGAEQAGGVAHHDDFKRAPTDQLQHVEQRREQRTATAEAELERGHGRQAGVAANHPDRRQ